MGGRPRLCRPLHDVVHRGQADPEDGARQRGRALPRRARRRRRRLGGVGAGARRQPRRASAVRGDHVLPDGRRRVHERVYRGRRHRHGRAAPVPRGRRVRPVPPMRRRAAVHPRQRSLRQPGGGGGDGGLRGRPRPDPPRSGHEERHGAQVRLPREQHKRPRAPREPAPPPLLSAAQRQRGHAALDVPRRARGRHDHVRVRSDGCVYAQRDPRPTHCVVPGVRGRPAHARRCDVGLDAGGAAAQLHGDGRVRRRPRPQQLLHRVQQGGGPPREGHDAVQRRRLRLLLHVRRRDV
mmetsp:Transcript_21465/g.53928  ORF Transcript_21465/g.53928 Transcript_21465/m.53928 type:complete len:294 (-) Transcript_21465:1126-2007(-)